MIEKARLNRKGDRTDPENKLKNILISMTALVL
jgi:hypothetical protein